MNKTGRYARVGTPSRDGDVGVVRALDPVTGLPVRIHRFEADPVSGAAAFRHPNAVRVLESGRDDDGGYVVAEVIDGAADLSARPNALDVATAAAAVTALAAAHAAGIVHGDPVSRRVLRRGDDVWLEGLGVPWRPSDPSDDVRLFARSLLDVPGHALPPAAQALLSAVAEDEHASAATLARSLDDLLGPMPSDEPSDEPTDEPAAEPSDEPTAEAAAEPSDEATDEAADEADDRARDEAHQQAAAGVPAEATDEPSDEPSEEPYDESMDERGEAPDAQVSPDQDDVDGTGPAGRAGEIGRIDTDSVDADTVDTDRVEADTVDSDTVEAARAEVDSIELDPPDGAPPSVVRRRVATHDVAPEPVPPPGTAAQRRTLEAARSAPPMPRPEPPTPRLQRAEPPRPQHLRPSTPPQRARPDAVTPPAPSTTPGGFSKTPPPDVTYRHGESPLDERHAGGGRTAGPTVGIRHRRRTWMLAALLLGALVLAIVTAVARRPVPPPTGPLGSVTSIVVDVRIEPASLPPASLVVVASPSGSRISAGSALGTVPRRVVFDAEGTWQVEARFQDRRSDIVTFRLPDEREVVLRFPALP